MHRLCVPTDTSQFGSLFFYTTLLRYPRAYLEQSSSLRPGPHLLPLCSGYTALGVTEQPLTATHPTTDSPLLARLPGTRRPGAWSVFPNEQHLLCGCYVPRMVLTLGRHSNRRGPAGTALQEGEVAQGLRVQCDMCRPEAPGTVLAGHPPPHKGTHDRLLRVPQAGGYPHGLGQRMDLEVIFQFGGGSALPSLLPVSGSLRGLPVIRGCHLCLPFWRRGPVRAQLLSPCLVAMGFGGRQLGPAEGHRPEYTLEGLT